MILPQGHTRSFHKNSSSALRGARKTCRGWEQENQERMRMEPNIVLHQNTSVHFVVARASNPLISEEVFNLFSF